jgi:hypothetical protein
VCGKVTKGLLEKVDVVFQDMEILSNDMSNFEIERMIKIILGEFRCHL